MPAILFLIYQIWVYKNRWPDDLCNRKNIIKMAYPVVKVSRIEEQYGVVYSFFIKFLYA